MREKEQHLILQKTALRVYKENQEKEKAFQERRNQFQEELKATFSPAQETLKPWQADQNWVAGNCHTIKNFVTVPEANLYTIEDQLQRLILDMKEKEASLKDIENLQAITDLLREVRLGK